MSEQTLMNLLRRLEWSGVSYGQGSGYMGSGGDGPRVSSCPICKGINPEDKRRGEFVAGAWGHRELCDMEYQLRIHSA